MTAAGSASTHLDARLLLAHVLARDAAWLLAHDDELLDAANAQRFDAAVAARAEGMPVAYLLGSAGFYGRSFAVGPAVLVPRPESEQLIDLALAFARAARGDDALRALDVGTGSGVLAITLAAECSSASVDALDLSAAALAIARENARTHGVRARVRMHLDGSFGASLRDAGARYDAILANLPYVRRGDLRARPDPTSFEPRLALDGGSDGLDAYRGLLVVAPRLLAEPGCLLMEAGPDTVEPLARLARRAFGADASVVVHVDAAGLGRIVEVTLASRAPRETTAPLPNIDRP